MFTFFRSSQSIFIHCLRFLNNYGCKNSGNFKSNAELGIPTLEYNVYILHPNLKPTMGMNLQAT
jgi:hypothetical protein